jgi:hypothetical protein
VFGPLNFSRTRIVFAGSTSTQFTACVLTWTRTLTWIRPTRAGDALSQHAWGWA